MPPPFRGDQVGDERCMEAADGSGLTAGGRTFKAWLGYPDASASSRIAEYGPWDLLNDGGDVLLRATPWRWTVTTASRPVRRGCCQWWLRWPAGAWPVARSPHS
jgi:hypothetical protein